MDSGHYVKTRAEISKRSVILVMYLTGLLTLIVCITVASTVSPPLTDENKFFFKNCLATSSIICLAKSAPITLSISMTPYNQVLYLDTYFTSNKLIETDVTYNFTLTSTSEAETKNVLKETQTKSLSCENSQCKLIELFYLPYVKNSVYKFSIQFNNVNDIDSLQLRFTYIHEKFTAFLLGVKYFFLAISIVSQSVFIYYSVKVPLRLWTPQTRIVGIMGISLIVFNEPLLAATIKELTPEWSAISVFCNIQFIACILMYWIITLQQNINLPFKKIFLGVEISILLLIFSLMFVVYMYVTILFKYDPGYDWKNDFGKTEQSVFITAIVFLVVIAVWLVVLVIWNNIWPKKQNISNTILSTVMIGLCFIALGLGAFQPFPKASGLLLGFVALFNIYFILLQWLFTPSYSSYLEFLSSKSQIPEPTNEALGKDEVKDPSVTFEIEI